MSSSDAIIGHANPHTIRSNVPLSDIWSFLDGHPIFPSDGFRSQIKNELKQNYGANVSKSAISFVDRS